MTEHKPTASEPLPTNAPRSITEPRTEASDTPSLQGLADKAYCDYIAQMRRDLCLGVEYKLSNGQFTRDNLEAYMRASELLGQHKAFQLAANELSALTRNLADLSERHRRLKELAKTVYATRHLGQDRKEMSDLHAFLEEE